MATWSSERARLAGNSRHHGPNSEQALEARRALKAARLEDAISRAVDSAPPLTPEQRRKLAVLLLTKSDLDAA